MLFLKMTTADNDFGVCRTGNQYAAVISCEIKIRLSTRISLIQIVCPASAQCQRTIYFVRVRGETCALRSGGIGFDGNHQPIRVQMFSYGDYEPFPPSAAVPSYGVRLGRGGGKWI